ncbi:MAG: ATP-binding protein [Candidatus Eremiobacteraeota bacterium]|nr:ATP-binding protein [Candidatus Eremiobacteraeota bacterium]
MTPLKELIDRLVDQFSDPYAFLREMVQNSLDAGSPEVEFELEHAQGTTVLTCQDTGEGMDEQLIDQRLTRIFASSKEDDLTKIGQFGIGFLSLFALKPDHVVVDTGRNGQFWRVHFTPDRTFSKARLTDPVEGTRIRWVKHQDSPREFEENCRQALQHWCRHAEAHIRWNGREINQPFDLQVSLQVQGTRVSLQPGRGFLGLYNRGLTLSEEVEELWPDLDVKINSRYLTHTLTRDRVVRNENFQKASKVVEEAIDQLLIPRLLERGNLRALAPHLGRLSQEQRELPLLAPYSLSQLQDQHLVLVTERLDPLAQRLREQGKIVVEKRAGLQQLLGATLLDVHEAYVLAEVRKASPGQQAWLQRLQRVLSGLGDHYQSIRLAVLPGHLPLLPCHQIYEPIPLAFQPDPAQPRQLLVNARHALWKDLWDLDQEWGDQALCQALWSAFPRLFPDEASRLQFALREDLR